MAGQGQPNVSTSELAPTSVAIQSELATSWNYGISINPSGSRDVGGVVQQMADEHPEWTLDATIIRLQTEGKSQISNRTLPKGCYLQNEQGQLITAKGAVLPAGGVPLLRVTTPELAEEVGCPDSLFAADATKAIARLAPVYENCSSCKVSRLNEDGEFLSELSKGNLSADPKVAAAFEKSGAGTWQEYHGAWRVRLTAEYRDAIIRGVPAMHSANYSEYQVQGTNPYFGNWDVTRDINTIGRAGMRYSTADFYVPTPRLWYSGAGPWHGINWLEEVRRWEIDAGDTLFSPFVAAGWHIAEEENVRPAQWLGLLKVLGNWGAEFFYAGFFSLSKPFPIPGNWIWQAAVPGYAQAITSQIADLFFSSEVMRGDLYSAYTLATPTPGQLGYCLWAGAGNRIAMARKHRSKAVYLVSATVQRYSNVPNSSMLSANATVRLPNTTIDLEVEVRRQGSTYVLDDTATAASGGAPRLVQLDGFHEATHPWYWSPHGAVEAEMFDGFLRGGELDEAIATETPAEGGAGSNAYSFLGFTSYVTLPPHEARVLEYNWECPPSRAGAAHFVWVRGRARAPRQSGDSVTLHARHSGGTAAMELPIGQGWAWRRLEGAVLPADEAPTALSVALGRGPGHSRAMVDVDRLVFTADAGYTPG